MVDDVHWLTWDVPGRSWEEELNLTPGPFPRIKLNRVRTRPVPKKDAYTNVSTGLVPLSQSPWTRPSIFLEADGRSRPQNCLPGCHPTPLTPFPLKSIEGGRQVSLMLCVTKDDVTSQPGMWIRSEIGSKQGNNSRTAASFHLNVHGNRTVCRFYSQTQRAQCHIRREFSPTIRFFGAEWGRRVAARGQGMDGLNSCLIWGEDQTPHSPPWRPSSLYHQQGLVLSFTRVASEKRKKTLTDVFHPRIQSIVS